MSWWDDVMMDAVRDRARVESGVPAPRLPADAFGPPPIIDVEPVLTVAGAQVGEIDRWLRDLMAEHVQRETWQWFADRGDWPVDDLQRAWMPGGEWSVVHARAVCKAAAAARERIAGVLPEWPAALTVMAGRGRAGQRPVWLGMPDKVFGGCECGSQSRHPRTIARCEWNERHGWRPRPSDQAEQGDRNGD